MLIDQGMYAYSGAGGYVTCDDGAFFILWLWGLVLLVCGRSNDIDLVNFFFFSLERMCEMFEIEKVYNFFLCRPEYIYL